MKNKKNTLHILLGLALFIVIAFLAPRGLFTQKAYLAIATMFLMVYWWITRPVHIAVTALIPIIVNSIAEMVPMADVLDDYASPIVVLLLGANILTITWSIYGLDKRIALKSLTIIGTSIKGQLVIWFVLSTLFSTVLPNAVVAAALCPIAVSMIKYSYKDNQGSQANLVLYYILLAIVWGAGLGGFGTPLGGAMNLVAINHIESITGTEFMYITWTLKMLPYLILLSIGIIVYLLLLKIDEKSLPGSRQYFIEEYKLLGSMTKPEKISLVLFIIPLILSFTRPLYSKLLPNFKPFYAFLFAGIVGLFINGNKGERLITWQQASKKINWSLMILFSGGLAVGNLLIKTGAIKSISESVSSMEISSILLIIFVFVALGMFLSNTSSNTAATAVLIPMVIGIISVLGKNPLPFIFVSAAACNCAFILPTSIRAIPVGYRLDVEFMFKKGLLAVGISLILLTIIGYIAIVVI
jgi:sodium-dependent dicarboxylate transporter 2/3/5